jgi:N,N-dimethylformamidase
MKQIMGYSDKISVHPGETIDFMISCEKRTSYKARIVQIIHGDTNPEGPGYKERAVQSSLAGSYQGRKQQIHAGSCAVVPGNEVFDELRSFALQMLIWPTIPEKPSQTLVSLWHAKSSCGFTLGISGTSGLTLTLGDGNGGKQEIHTGTPLLPREWYFIATSYDADSGEIRLVQEPLIAYGKVDSRAEVTEVTKLKCQQVSGTALIFAAHAVGDTGKQLACAGHYNGKIDRPRLVNRALARLEMEQLRSHEIPPALIPAVIGAWDFSKEITTEKIIDTSPHRHHGETINLPARAMTGFNWTGEEMCWRHKPEHYGAIHFHDDDLYDSGWEVDFSFTVPTGLKSGLYAAHVETEDDEDFIPFVIKPERGKPSSKLVFVLPTASYLAYANEHMATDAPLAEHLTGQIAVFQPADVFLNEHREYSGSCYDSHSDGSGVCYSSRLRPILTMRPKYQSWLGGKGSSLWQLNADTHIIDWLEAMQFDYDCITDEDLHNEGYQAISSYRVFVTSTHHEYWSKEMWDALDAFKTAGGRLIYTGANAWYWRIAYHPSKPGVIEVRRAEGGIRAWAAEPGEYYHSFTGEYGGLWRRQGRAPQKMAGTGFTAQGFDLSSYFRRKPDSFDPRAGFIFEGVGKDELIGDFGLIGGGAAGLELDRADRLLGTPPNALLLASSEHHTPVYMVVLEEIFINAPGLCNGESDLVRADLTFFETPSGGAVFATSSIAWAGSLSHNNYRNNVSLITSNVVKRFLDEKTF